MRALADRGAVRDLIDVHTASRHHTTAALETLGRRHARDESCLEDLQACLAGAEWYEDEEFTVYGLTEADTATLRAWARTGPTTSPGRCTNTPRRLTSGRADESWMTYIHAQRPRQVTRMAGSPRSRSGRASAIAKARLSPSTNAGSM